MLLPLVAKMLDLLTGPTYYVPPPKHHQHKALEGVICSLRNYKNILQTKSDIDGQAFNFIYEYELTETLGILTKRNVAHRLSSGHSHDQGLSFWLGKSGETPVDYIVTGVDEDILVEAFDNLKDYFTT